MNKKILLLLSKLDKAKTEEDVKAAWAKCFDLDYNTSDDHDLYTPTVIFEFKHERNFDNSEQLATVLAQVMYYLRRLKFGLSDKGIPAALCLANKHACAIAQVSDWKDVYIDERVQFDWDLRPSNSDPKLVTAIQRHPSFKSFKPLHLNQPQEAVAVFDQLTALLSPQSEIQFGDKKIITEANFEDVFDYWNHVFGESVRNGFKSSRYFVADIQKGRTQVVASQGKVYFQVGPEDVRIKKILAADYEHFWSLYEKVTDTDTVRGILAKIDRLTDDVQRRKHGEFFTPVAFAKKALDYFEKELGRAWWSSGKYRVWDMAAGTGNLQYNLPAAALPYCYLSTLYREDAEHCERLFPGATVFQYDYLNDDVGNLFAGGAEINGQNGFDFDTETTWKMPEGLRRDLSNPSIKWVVLINPPFATAQQGGATGSNKADVSMTKLRTKMHADDLGEVSRELFAQFLYRIRREFKGHTAWLGMFSKLKYINATNDQKLRDSVFRYRFRRGFMFSSVNFSGTSSSSQFPVGFLIWNLKSPKPLETQNIVLDVFDTEVLKTGTKPLSASHRDAFLSKWIARPGATIKFPPFSSAITVKHSGPDIRDRISKDFIGSLMCKGNDFQNQNMTALLSGPYASAGGHSITPAIFEQCMVVHAVRRLPKAEWHNDRDQYLQPVDKLPRIFINDCVVWSLFSNSNNTVALRDVIYEGTTFQISNHFFPFLLQEVSAWPQGDADLALQFRSAEDRFVAQWLAAKSLSRDAKAVVQAGRMVYQNYFAQAHRLRTAKFKIQTWDAGWWQIKNALTDMGLADEELSAVKNAQDKLKNKLLPQIMQLGFLC